jgi:hypothetical protein
MENNTQPTDKNIDKQVTQIKMTGEKITDYLKKYEGQPIYNHIALAVEFGYQLCIDEPVEHGNKEVYSFGLASKLSEVVPDKNIIDISNVTRLEVIDHSRTGKGRVYTNYNCKDVEIELQDDNRTLKIFIK